jgi:hypothetical protein
VGREIVRRDLCHAQRVHFRRISRAGGRQKGESAECDGGEQSAAERCVFHRQRDFLISGIVPALPSSCDDHFHKWKGNGRIPASEDSET